MNFYQKDLSEIHDKAFGSYAENGAIELLHALQKNGLQHGTIVDLGCGSGILAKKLTDAGYDVIGVDYSADMIEIAKAKVPKAKFVQASFSDYELPECIAVSASGGVINYLVDDKNREENLFNLFKNIYKKLVRNGIFMFDFVQYNLVGTASGTIHRVHGEEDWTIVTTITEDKSSELQTRKLIIFKQQNNGLYRKSTEVHQLKLLNENVIEGFLKKVGFKADLVTKFGEYVFRKGHIGILAQKV